MTCTFFGHNNTPAVIKPLLRNILIDLIEKHGTDKFYVGDHGSFDKMATAVLRELKQIYPNIEYRVVPAYLSNDGNESKDPTEFLDEIKKNSKRFSINFRNKWMLAKADIVLAYINYGWGSAAKFVGLAKRSKKIVINLSGADIEL